jgi:hypothetical protein
VYWTSKPSLNVIARRVGGALRPGDGLRRSAIELGDAAVHLGRPRGFGVLVHLGGKTLQQQSGEGRAGLSRQRERILQNLCGMR